MYIEKVIIERTYYRIIRIYKQLKIIKKCASAVMSCQADISSQLARLPVLSNKDPVMYVYYSIIIVSFNLSTSVLLIGRNNFRRHNLTVFQTSSSHANLPFGYYCFCLWRNFVMYFQFQICKCLLIFCRIAICIFPFPFSKYFFVI